MHVILTLRDPPRPGLLQQGKGQVGWGGVGKGPGHKVKGLQALEALGLKRRDYVYEGGWGGVGGRWGGVGGLGGKKCKKGFRGGLPFFVLRRHRRPKASVVLCLPATTGPLRHWQSHAQW